MWGSISAIMTKSYTIQCKAYCVWTLPFFKNFSISIFLEKSTLKLQMGENCAYFHGIIWSKGSSKLSKFKKTTRKALKPKISQNKEPKILAYGILGLF